ncbi:MAG: OsmC/Ohr family protein [uncultured Truepera sp.]|uniref:OsmC/Ohr family protein n=1 Tax=uncultured Truepera sp. TaxID=543023 RepID=A0A6J4VGS6_9DEIN|nr:MAG: OsmC/Ohr family protein [uncultured Truepera sp.]
MTTKTTTVHHLVDKRFVGVTPDGQRVMIDGEAEAKTGPNPMELLLNALGACAAFDVVEMLKKRRLDVQGYRIELSGERPDAVPAPYTHIHARHVFDVPGLDEKTATRFVDLAMNKYCSVASSLKAEISFEVALEVPAPQNV